MPFQEHPEIGTSLIASKLIRSIFFPLENFHTESAKILWNSPMLTVRFQFQGIFEWVKPCIFRVVGKRSHISDFHSHRLASSQFSMWVLLRISNMDFFNLCYRWFCCCWISLCCYVRSFLCFYDHYIFVCCFSFCFSLAMPIYAVCIHVRHR